mmetsp:Transcript_49419/g.82247  ORF Transcript_49419/g.82247 Transcript_49419/m.82247 type:complete len:306 (-) Transcript_49419:277-1194(-)
MHCKRIISHTLCLVLLSTSILASIIAIRVFFLIIGAHRKRIIHFRCHRLCHHHHMIICLLLLRLFLLLHSISILILIILIITKIEICKQLLLDIHRSPRSCIHTKPTKMLKTCPIAFLRFLAIRRSPTATIHFQNLGIHRRRRTIHMHYYIRSIKRRRRIRIEIRPRIFIRRRSDSPIPALHRVRIGTARIRHCVAVRIEEERITFTIIVVCRQLERTPLSFMHRSGRRRKQRTAMLRRIRCNLNLAIDINRSFRRLIRIILMISIVILILIRGSKQILCTSIQMPRFRKLFRFVLGLTINNRNH